MACLPKVRAHLAYLCLAAYIWRIFCWATPHASLSALAGSAERARLLASLPGCAFIEQQSPADDGKRVKASHAGISSSGGMELKRESKRATAASAAESKRGSTWRRIRLGFLCSDFVNHCTGDLVQSMFQHFT